MLHEIFHTLPAIRNEARLAKTDEPYLYQYYNIHPYFPSNSIIINNNVLRLANSLVEALNKRQNLPRMLVFFPDKDLLSALGPKFLINRPERAIARLIDWITNFVNREISTRKVDMYAKKPSSVSPGEPKFLWIKMLNRFQNRDATNSYRLCFNSMLEEAISSRKHSYIIDPSHILKPAAFDRNGALRAGARIELWVEINQQIELFDKQKLSLKPAPRPSTSSSRVSPPAHENKKGYKAWQTKY